MRHHGKEDQPPPVRRPRLPNVPKSGSPDQDPFQSLFAYAYLQAQNQRKRASEEVNKDAESLSAVMAAQNTLAVSDFTLSEKLDFIAEQARKILDASGAVIALREDDAVVCKARAGLVGPPLGARLNSRLGISGECIRSGEVLHCEDTESDTRVDLVACRELGIRSILAIPLKRQDETLGLLEIFSGWAGFFKDRDIRAAKLLGGQVIEALWAETARVRPQPATPAAHAEAAVAPATQAPAIPEPIVLAEPAPASTTELAASSLDSASAGAAAIELPFSFLQSEPRSPLLSLKIVVGALAIVALLGTFAWQQVQLRTRAFMPAAAPPRPDFIIIPQPTDTAAESSPAAAQTATSMSPAQLAPAQLTEVHFRTKADSTSIALSLDGPVKYVSATLHGPERFYFDLHQTTLGSKLLHGKKDMLIAVNDPLVSKIRVAKKSETMVRVVVDLKKPAEFTDVLSPSAPFRLMISIHPAGSPVSKLDLLRGDDFGTVQPAPEQAKTIAPAPAVAARHRLTIVIDPGHGGREEGAVGPHGLKEKDLVLDVARRLGDRLATKFDAEIYFTRNDDRNVGLDERTAIANQRHADLFISIHANSSGDPNARGIETYYVDSAFSAHEAEVAARENSPSGKPLARPATAKTDTSQKIERSRKLAACIQEALFSKLSDREPSLRNRGVKKAPFVVLLGAEMPSVLAEISFLSSPEDERELEAPESRDLVADALYRGIAKYLATANPKTIFPRTMASAGN